MHAPSPEIGRAETLMPGLRRVIAPNASPMTYWGTNTYLLGRDNGLCVIDPGPDNPKHLAALLDAIGTASVSHIVVTHSHLDHSPLAAPLAARTGAPVLGFGTFQAGRSAIMQHLIDNGLTSGGEGIDTAFTPDQAVANGDTITGRDWTLKVLHTPGHLGNHICLLWNDVILTGDHIMGWSSSLVSPPDGDLTDFMASCHKLMSHDVRRYLPGHGPVVTDPMGRLRWLIDHRIARGKQILAILERQPSGMTLSDLTATAYLDTHPHLHPAAERNLLAHLIDLSTKKVVSFDNPMRKETLFTAF